VRTAHGDRNPRNSHPAPCPHDWMNDLIGKARMLETRRFLGSIPLTSSQGPQAGRQVAVSEAFDATCNMSSTSLQPFQGGGVPKFHIDNFGTI